MIDEGWKEHLREMDELRHSVQKRLATRTKGTLCLESTKLESYNLSRQW